MYLRTISIFSALVCGSLALAKGIFLAGDAMGFIRKGPPYYMHAWLNVGIVLSVSVLACSLLLGLATSLSVPSSR